MAEAENVDIAAIAQAATPIDKRRFMLGILQEPRDSGRCECFRGPRVPSKHPATAINASNSAPAHKLASRHQSRGEI
jgi:hypothetical protein